MRMPKYLSPSSLKTFEKNREEFYLKYLADNRPDRMPQTEPMSVGSAFDAFVKSRLYHSIHGHYGPNNEYARDTIFEQQVEPQNRDFARVAGEHVYKQYAESGALSDMMLELSKSITEPRFEFNIEGVVDSKIGNIPLLGKPDIFFVSEQSARVVWDWKVNGYCGRSLTSPTKGYVKVRDAWQPIRDKRSNSRNNFMPHKDCVLGFHQGIQINTKQYMEDCNAEWADQLAIYSWLLGEPIGSENVIIGIDQIVGCGENNGNPPFLKVASHRTRISSNYQFNLLARLEIAWNAILTGHIFGHLSREDNDAKIKNLDETATVLSDGSEMADFLNSTCRTQ